MNGLPHPTAFPRVEPRVNLITIGHTGHGKTTLTAAISKVLHDRMPDRNPYLPFDAIDNPPRRKVRGVPIAAARAEYQTEARSYAQVDCPAHADCVKYMIAGAGRIDGAILVVSAQDNPQSQTKEHLLVARQVGVRHLVVALNKVEVVGDRDALELSELAVSTLLTTYGYPGDDVPLVRISALKALAGDDLWSDQVVELMNACDTAIPEPEVEIEKPFLMPIQDIAATAGRGAVVTGRVERGRLRPLDEVEIVGIKERSFHAAVTGIGFLQKELDEARAGEICRLLLEGVRREDVEPGMVVVKPGTASPHTEFEATVHMLSQEEGGRYTAFFRSYRTQFYFRSTEITGVVRLPEGTESVMPGETATVSVELLQPIALEVGLRFTIREAGRTIGAGCVTHIR